MYSMSCRNAVGTVSGRKEPGWGPLHRETVPLGDWEQAQIAGQGKEINKPSLEQAIFWQGKLAVECANGELR